MYVHRSTSTQTVCVQEHRREERGESKEGYDSATYLDCATLRCAAAFRENIKKEKSATGHRYYTGI